jgi:hypothetical protein
MRIEGETMSPTDPIYLFCGKRNQRLSVSVCLFRKCGHLGEEGGEFFCKFVSEVEKKIKGRKGK